MTLVGPLFCFLSTAAEPLLLTAMPAVVKYLPAGGGGLHSNDNLEVFLII